MTLGRFKIKSCFNGDPKQRSLDSVESGEFINLDLILELEYEGIHIRGGDLVGIPSKNMGIVVTEMEMEPIDGLPILGEERIKEWYEMHTFRSKVPQKAEFSFSEDDTIEIVRRAEGKYLADFRVIKSAVGAQIRGMYCLDLENSDSEIQVPDILKLPTSNGEVEGNVQVVNRIDLQDSRTIWRVTVGVPEEAVIIVNPGDLVSIIKLVPSSKVQ